MTGMPIGSNPKSESISMISDHYTGFFYDLWKGFRQEMHLPEPEPYSIDELTWTPAGPTQTLERLWESGEQRVAPGSRGQKILDRVREWLRGAEQSALHDREEVESLLERCVQRPALKSWRTIANDERERADQEEPRDGPEHRQAGPQRPRRLPLAGPPPPPDRLREDRRRVGVVRHASPPMLSSGSGSSTKRAQPLPRSRVVSPMRASRPPRA